MNPDYRTREGREKEVLAEIEIGGRLSRAWLNAIPQRRAAWFRLLQSGRVVQKAHRMLYGDDVILAKVVEQRREVRSLWQSLVEGVRGVMQ